MREEGIGKTLMFMTGRKKFTPFKNWIYSDPECLVCKLGFKDTYLEDGKNPVDALTECSVEEVRRALAAEGVGASVVDNGTVRARLTVSRPMG